MMQKLGLTEEDLQEMRIKEAIKYGLAGGKVSNKRTHSKLRNFGNTSPRPRGSNTYITDLSVSKLNPEKSESFYLTHAEVDRS